MRQEDLVDSVVPDAIVCNSGGPLLGASPGPPLGAFHQLLRAKRELELDKLLKKLSRFDALMIDDFGYVKQDRDEMEVLFTLLAHRYERGSMLITSNLPFSKWEVIFKDPMTTAAAIDRLVHHSVVLELNVPSYRAEQARKRKKTG